MTKSLSTFAKAFGLTAPIRVVYTHTETGASGDVELNEAFALLGSWPTCAIRLEDPSVSRKHAYLQVIQGRPFLTDLASRNGLIFGNELAHNGWWWPGQPVRVGKFELRYGEGGEPEPTAPPPTAQATNGEPKPLALVFTGSDGRDVFFPLRTTLATIGQSHRCELRIDDKRISPFHAAIAQSADSTWLVDLLAFGGTWVNGRAVRYSRLLVGDRVSLNGFELEVQQSETTVVQTPPTLDSVEFSGRLSTGIHPAVPDQPDLITEIRQFQLMMAKLFTSLQEEQARLARQQCDVLELLATAIRDGRLPNGPGPESSTPHPPWPQATPDDPSPTPIPQSRPTPRTATPQDETALSHAHAWFASRFGGTETPSG